MNSKDAVKSEPIHLTLTLGDIDALVRAGQREIDRGTMPVDLCRALAKLDVAVNV